MESVRNISKNSKWCGQLFHLLNWSPVEVAALSDVTLDNVRLRSDLNREPVCYICILFLVHSELKQVKQAALPVEG